MLKELFESIAAQSVKASGVTITQIDGDPRRVIVTQGDKFEFQELPNYRRHCVSSLDSLIDAIEVYGKAGSVWHSCSDVTCLIDDTERRDMIHLSLQYSAQFIAIAGLKNEGLDQRCMIRLLRHDLAGCTDGAILPIVRKVEFKSSSVSRGDRQHGQESLGKAVDAAINIAGDLPEVITLSIPIYKTRGLQKRMPFVCSLDVNLQTERFVLMPLPNELDNAVDQIQDELHDELSESGVHVFYGSP